VAFDARISSNTGAVPVSAKPSDQSCGQCGKTSTDAKLKKCIGCHFQTYCGETCQRTHWPLHKPICISMKNPKDPSVQESSTMGLNYKSIGTKLMELVEPIIAPEDIISDLELNLDTSLNNDSMKIYQKYKQRYVDRCKADLKTLMVRDSCHQASSRMGKIHSMSTDIAVTKFGVCICREKSSVVLYNLAMQDLKCHVLQMINPNNSAHTHGFIVMGISETILYSIVGTGNFSLDTLLASEKLYIIDPLLKWHGPSSEYINSPLHKYNQGLGISALLECTAQPTKSEIDTILKESEAIYQSAKGIFPQVNPSSFPIWNFLEYIGANSL